MAKYHQEFIGGVLTRYRPPASTQKTLLGVAKVRVHDGNGVREFEGAQKVRAWG